MRLAIFAIFVTTIALLAPASAQAECTQESISAYKKYVLVNILQTQEAELSPNHAERMVEMRVGQLAGFLNAGCPSNGSFETHIDARDRVQVARELVSFLRSTVSAETFGNMKERSAAVRHLIRFSHRAMPSEEQLRQLQQ